MGDKPDNRCVCTFLGERTEVTPGHGEEWRKVTPWVRVFTVTRGDRTCGYMTQFDRTERRVVSTCVYTGVRK